MFRVTTSDGHDQDAPDRACGAGCGISQWLHVVAGDIGAEDTTLTPHGDLSGQEYAFAVDLARREISKDQATVTSATAAVRPGTVQQPNLSGHCDSGRLLHLKLIGTFPTIVTDGHVIRPGTHPDFTVRAVMLTADAESGEACLVGVGTGNQSPQPGSVVLDLS